jgi:hypothetical protein
VDLTPIVKAARKAGARTVAKAAVASCAVGALGYWVVKPLAEYVSDYYRYRSYRRNPYYDEAVDIDSEDEYEDEESDQEDLSATGEDVEVPQAVATVEEPVNDEEAGTTSSLATQGPTVQRNPPMRPHPEGNHRWSRYIRGLGPEVGRVPKIVQKYVRMAKTRFYNPTRDRANELAVHSYIQRQMRKDNVRLSDMHKYLTRCVEGVFTPSHWEIKAAAMPHGPASRSNRRVFQWLQAKQSQ